MIYSLHFRKNGEILMQINLYDSTNIDSLNWLDNYDHQYAKNFITPMIKNGTKKYISNVDTEMKLLTIDNLPIPITINNEEYNNSYVVSPYTQYIAYCIAELKRLNNPLLEKTFKIILTNLDKLFKKSNFNKVIIVNNWLLSTNLYPELTETHIKYISDYLIKKYPEHAIIFRSIEEFLPNGLFESFQKQNYKMILSRGIYFADYKKYPLKGKAISTFNRDSKLFTKHDYEIIQHHAFKEDDINRIVENYNMLYLDKHSYFNPQLTPEFIKLAIKNKILYLKGIKKDGKIDAVLGFFIRNRVMTTPLFGYDTSLPQEIGLYRMITNLIMKESMDRGIILHGSSGAGEFKRSRGFIQSFEYNAVYDKHLPLKRRWVWSILQKILNLLGKKLFIKYKL